ncbi:MAG: hypothetical protein HY082_03835 [Gammaproteobacteria bacterium]|nr:hypothetical protein [Gammaproteobacteria bacterium]
MKTFTKAILIGGLLAGFAASAMADNSSGASGSSGQRQRPAQDQQLRPAADKTIRADKASSAANLRPRRMKIARGKKKATPYKSPFLPEKKSPQRASLQ